ncbi:hypothetical protein [Streptomyces zagrosensis]|uniref:hypothetical protein n=1 Tax=Streptomyces zagrosensis TaxID=1042984 RepID=UPI0028A94C4E|nr:hypothetical protein [Streptomyces zagrosensis]
MGIESDQLVYDYLGKVGDLAQRQGLLSGDRVRLVSEVRADIDRRRAVAPGGDSPAAVKKLLAKIGTPAEVVAAAGGRSAGAAGAAPSEGAGADVGPAQGSGSGYAGVGHAADSGSGRAGGEASPDRGGLAGLSSVADQAARAAREKLSRLTERGSLTGGLTSGLTGRFTSSPRRDAGGSPGQTVRPATPDPWAEQPTEQGREGRRGPGLRKTRPGEASKTDGANAAGRASEADGAGRGGFAASPRVPAPRPPVRPPNAASPPHLAGEDELGPRQSAPDWWRTEPGPLDISPFDGSGPFAPQGAGAGYMDGFVGGIELPELLHPPTDPGRQPVEKVPAEDEDAETVEGADDGAAVDEGGGKRRGLVRRMLLPRRGGGAKAKGDSGAGGGSVAWLPVVAALSLVGGAAFGSWIALGVGWVLAYNTRSLSRNEAKFAAIGVPSLAVFGGLVWLWGRSEGRWGAAIAEGGMDDALDGTTPGVIRAAAIGSALYLVWRARRRPVG